MSTFFSLPGSSADSNDDSDRTRTAIITGSVAAGAYLTGAALRWLHRRRLPAPADLPLAIEAETRTFEIMEGRTHYYARPGSGTPIVLVHSFNAAASSFEMKPLFEHLAATTERPLYAIDWIGFGRSDRPSVDYRPVLYQRQLRRFLSEVIQEPADVIGLSLGAEYAARVAHATPVLVRGLALINPTGLTADRGPSYAGYLFVKLAGYAGAFELMYYRLTRRASLRDFYKRQVFLDSDAIPDELVDYAYTTTHAQGAHYAPQRFVDGTLFPDSSATSIYTRLNHPTLLLTPVNAAETVQGFEQVTEVLEQNAHDLSRVRLPGGLLPQFESPDALFGALDDFLTA